MASPEQEIEFLTKRQRVLREGAFVATYKYAFLIALAEVSVDCSAVRDPRSPTPGGKGVEDGRVLH